MGEVQNSDQLTRMPGVSEDISPFPVEATGVTDFAHSLAVVIGIDIYSHGIRPLTTAVNDATRLADLLRTAHGYETMLLTETEIAQPVTLEYLHKLFTEDLKVRLGNNDRLLVYFAGHGVALDGEDGPRGYMATQDTDPQNAASFLAMTALHTWLTDLSCRHMLAILDCCFAGAFRWSATRHLKALPDVIYKERYDRYLRSPAWQVLTSAAYDQEALDILAGNPIGRRESDHNLHSPFALALFDALEKGDADLIPKGQGDGVITATELYLYLREQVEVQAENLVNHEQTPGLWPLNKHRKGEFIFLAPGHPLNLPAAPTLTEEANPYRGLKSYNQKDSPIFFGRDQEVKELVALVDERPFLAVVGASGTGKSSLVKAGLLPHLQEEELPLQPPDAEGQPVERKYQLLKPIRPTDHPAQALAAMLRQELNGDPIRLTDDNFLSTIVEHWASAHPRQRLVLVIDQFEELVTLCRDEERERFLRLLATAIQQQPDTLRLIITLRTDFEPQFTQDKSPLAELWKEQKNRFIVPPMDIEDLRQVIEGPASVRVLYFDPPELVDDLIEEVIQTPGALPLLSFTLSELYIKYVQSDREDRALSGVDYKALGGVVGSLRNRATEEYKNLPDDAHRHTMQKVMLRMVSVEGSELARRRVALSELVYPTEEENVRVKTVLDRLVDARLLVRGTADNPDSTKGEAYVEPAHDALVLAWDKLLRWKKEAEEYLPLQRRLALAETEWRRAGAEAKSGLLWDNDLRLPQVEETLWPMKGRRKGPSSRLVWAMRTLWPDIDTPADTTWLNRVDLEFTQASIRARTLFWRRTVTVTLVIMTALSGLALFANAQRITAVNQRNRAQVGELSAQAKLMLETDPELSVLLASSALSRAKPEYAMEAENALREALQVSRIEYRVESSIMENPRDAVFAVDGAKFAVGDKSGIIHLISTSPGEKSVAEFDLGYNTMIWEVAFDQDGMRLGAVDSSNLGVVKVWDIESGQEVLNIQLGKEVKGIAFHPYDPVIVIQILLDETQEEVQLWNFDSKTQIAHAIVPDAYMALSFSQDGKYIAIVSLPDRISLWDSQLQNELTWWPAIEEREVSENILDIEFGPGNQLALASSTGRISLWDISEPGKPQLRFSIKGHKSEVSDLAFGQNGDCIASAGEDHYAKVWNAKGDALITLAGHTQGVRAVSFIAPDKTEHPIMPCGTQLATISSDGTARVWNIGPSRELKTIASHAEPIEAIDFSPNDGRYLLTASDDSTARIWTSGDNVLIKTVEHQQRINAAEFDQTGRALVTASHDGTAAIWRVDEATEPIWIRPDARIIRAAVFRPPDGQQVITGDDTGGVHLWDSNNGNHLALLYQSPRPVRVVGFDASGMRVIVGSEHGLVNIIEVNTNHVFTLTLNNRADVFDAAFGPDNESVFTLDSVGDVQEWQIDYAKESYWDGGDAHLIDRHTGGAQTIAFNPVGSTYATAGKDGIIILRDSKDPYRRSLISGNGSSINSLVFTPDGKTLAAATEDGLVRFYQVDIDDLVNFAHETRVTRPLAADECRLFGINDGCN